MSEEDLNQQEVDELRRDIARLLLRVMAEKGGPPTVPITLISSDIDAIAERQNPVKAAIDSANTTLAALSTNLGEAATTLGTVTTSIADLTRDVQTIKTIQGETPPSEKPGGKPMASKKQIEELLENSRKQLQLIEKIESRNTPLAVLGGRAGNQRRLALAVGWMLVIFFVGFVLGTWRAAPAQETASNAADNSAIVTNVDDGAANFDTKIFVNTLGPGNEGDGQGDGKGGGASSSGGSSGGGSVGSSSSSSSGSGKGGGSSSSGSSGGGSTGSGGGSAGGSTGGKGGISMSSGGSSGSSTTTTTSTGERSGSSTGGENAAGTLGAANPGAVTPAPNKQK